MDARNEKSVSIISQAKLDPAGDRWIVDGDVFAIDRTIHESDLQAANDPLRKQLQDTISKFSSDLAKRANRLSNSQTWSSLASAATAFHTIVRENPSYVSAHLGEAYAQLLRLGRLIETDVRVQHDPLCSDHALDPDIHGLLTDLVRTAAPWLRGFPTVAAWDNEAGKALVRADLLFQPSQHFVRVAKQKQSISSKDATEIESLTEIASNEDFLGHKASRRAIGTAHNLFLAEAEAIASSRIPHSSSESVATRIAIQRAAETITAAQPEIEIFLKPLPTDLREALQAVVEYSSEIDNILQSTSKKSDIPEDADDQTRDMLLKDRLPPDDWHPYVKRLNFRFNGFSNTDLLSYFKNLDYLDISDTAVRSLKHIANNRNIKTLKIASTSIKDISYLSDLRDLKILNLSRTKVDDLSSLEGLNLESLDVSYLKLTGSDKISSLKNLKEINLAGSDLSNFEFLSNLHLLEIVNLSQTRFNNISLLSKSPHISNLDISGTPTKDISEITNLKNLEVLHLRNTLVSNVEALKNLEKLRLVDLRGSYVSNISILKNLNARILHYSPRSEYGL